MIRVPLLFCVFLFHLNLMADVGPKPSRTFSLKYNFSPVPELYKGYYIECRDQNCSSWDTLGAIGPQEFNCNASSCTARAYGFRPYARIILRFSDTILVSNIFEAKGFNSTYDAIISETTLEVTETTSFWAAEDDVSTYVKFLLFSLLIECFAAIYFFRKWLISQKNLKWVALINIISLALMMFVILRLLDSFMGYFLGAVLVILIEAIAYQLLVRINMNMKRALTLSLFANLASFFAAGLSNYFLTHF